MENKTKKDNDMLNSLNISKVIIPILIGLSVVIYLLYKHVDVDTILEINWSLRSFVWLSLGVLAYVLRHLFYSWRLRIISSNFFSWIKSIELIFIWEFASAVTPTSVGGSAVAMFLLAQEKLSGVKTFTIIIYSAVLDGLFFIVSLVALFLIFGPIIIRPEMHNMQDIDGYGHSFYVLLLVMSLYSFIFFYGIFINPRGLKRVLFYLSNWKILKRFKEVLRKNAIGIEASSLELRSESIGFHLTAFLSTTGAWVMRFLAINFFILAIYDEAVIDIYNHIIVYARGEVMYVITAFSPTPGAAGIAEYLFAGFYSDYIPSQLGVIAAMIWRLVSYYLYLFIGMVLVPNWIRKILNKRRLTHK